MASAGQCCHCFCSSIYLMRVGLGCRWASNGMADRELVTILLKSDMATMDPPK